MDERENELMHGMVNCYNTCHEDFEGTVHMVARARGLSEKEAKAILEKIREEYGTTGEYKSLRSKLPKDFPL
ncbi:MAG: hypothetical protein M1125_01280 [Candidatus Marsarchaeota archaeon]|nr:hypothetical protein [Candidatus Marsarchaeota archaeon]